ncbi:hypothetical protein [Mycolicibacter virginiensis]|uniref:hypothetical protein n=1 Tax=Mycolicibacter virginiensis TaxID=1795032 RepID=UPI001F0439F5|nr:hypothetical protein [Mycolicibacter virginiensis]ULP48014.1 hypothetical protein MJO54_02260 [Mycolicibacter virginiensis]
MGDIEIRGYDGFRAVLGQLDSLTQQISARRDAGAKVAAAAASAADSEGSVAPVYVPSLTALSSCIDGAGNHVDAAASAVASVLGELEMVLSGMQGIDESAANAVTNV